MLTGRSTDRKVAGTTADNVTRAGWVRPASTAPCTYEIAVHTTLSIRAGGQGRDRRPRQRTRPGWTTNNRITVPYFFGAGA